MQGPGHPYIGRLALALPPPLFSRGCILQVLARAVGPASLSAAPPPLAAAGVAGAVALPTTVGTVAVDAGVVVSRGRSSSAHATAPSPVADSSASTAAAAASTLAAMFSVNNTVRAPATAVA